MVKPAVFALLASVLLAGCGERIEEFGGPTMGSTYSIKYVRGQGVADARTLQAAHDSALTRA